MSETEPATEQRPAFRSSFTRISSAFGFSQKPRWIQDFRIELDHKNPKHRYSPGDVIRGTIFFTPTKAVKITHIIISLYGYVHVYKTFNAPGDFVSKETLHSDPSKLLSFPGIVPLFTPIEEVLFADVKLQPCRGKFEFAIRLPTHRLPSSIDFERGSIQYNLMATITRPGHINPVIRSDPKKFWVNEIIDCCKFPKPHQQIATLAPVEKKKKGKKTPSLTINAEKFGFIATVTEHEPSSPRSSIAASTDGSHHDDTASVSNSSSSTELRITNVTSHSAGNTVSLVGGSQNGSVNGSHGSRDGSQEGAPGSNHNSNATSRHAASQKSGSKAPCKPAPQLRTVSASAELQRGAFLPGDSIPVHVQVTHTKYIKSMCGLIVTLYRKTHIETEPLVHEWVKDNDGNVTLQPVTGDYMPKSLTGFGGLSMSNKQTSHTFRMDIAQTHVPLLIDPKTLKADIKVKLDIPLEGVHPTITKVRGDTIDFRYYVEVCLDVQGKLEETRLLPRLTNQAVHGLGKASARKSPSVPMSLASQGQQMIDTQAIRRDKPQIVVLTFDLVIGTRDSGRGIRSNLSLNSKRQVDPWSQSGVDAHQQSSVQGSENSRISRLDDVQEDTFGEEGRTLDGRAPGNIGNDGRQQSPPYLASSSPRATNRWQHSMSAEELSRTRSYSPPPPPGPPLMLSSETIDEKTRLKQQEQRLLPSQPDVGSSRNTSFPFIPPSAPFADDSGSVVDQHWDASTNHVDQADSGYSSSGPGPSSRPMVYRSRTHDDLTSGLASQAVDQQQVAGSTAQDRRVPRILTSNAFSGFDFNQGSPSRPPAAVSDDKQELERRRLMDQRSAPVYGEPRQHGETSPAFNIAQVPSEETDHDAFGEWDNNQEGLPKYENLND